MLPAVSQSGGGVCLCVYVCVRVYVADLLYVGLGEYDLSTVAPSGSVQEAV